MKVSAAIFGLLLMIWTADQASACSPEEVEKLNQQKLELATRTKLVDDVATYLEARMTRHLDWAALSPEVATLRLEARREALKLTTEVARINIQLTDCLLKKN